MKKSNAVISNGVCRDEGAGDVERNLYNKNKSLFLLPIGNLKDLFLLIDFSLLFALGERNSVRNDKAGRTPHFPET